MSKKSTHTEGKAVGDLAWMQWADGEGDAPHNDVRPSPRSGAAGGALAPDARGAHVAALVGVVGEAVRTRYGAIADANDDAVAALWQGIAQQIRTADGDANAAAPAARRVRGGWRYVATAVASAAVASALTLWLGAGGKTRPQDSVAGVAGHGAVEPSAWTAATPGGEGAAPSHMVQAIYRQPPSVESLDVPDGSGTVITVEDPEGNTAVIWVTPNELKESL